MTGVAALDERRKWQGLLQYLYADLVIADVDVIRDWSESRVVRLSGLLPDGSPLTLYAKHDRSADDREVTVYRAAAGLSGFPAPAARFVSGPDGVEWLIIREAHGKPLHALQPADWVTACGALAAFHERAACKNWASGIDGLPALRDSLDGLPWPILEVTARCARDGRYSGVDGMSMDAAARRLMEAWVELAAVIAGYPVTLLHGDSHSGNLFLSPDGSIELIDWATAQTGPGLCDVIGLFDTAERMHEDCPRVEAMNAYWNGLSEQSRPNYGDFGRACESLRVLRALTELGWFATSGDDYGERANREFGRIVTSLDSLRL